jgi:hypothetical protein
MLYGKSFSVHLNNQSFIKKGKFKPMNNKLSSNYVKPTPSKIKIHYIAHLVLRKLGMESDYRDKQRKSYTTFRTVYDITISILLLGMAALMLFASKFKIDFLMMYDASFRYMFGGLCLLYGAFRLYRGLKKNY